MTTGQNDVLAALTRILGRCILFGFALLLIWTAVMIWGNGLVERQAEWFGVSAHECDLVVYSLLGFTKVLVLVFFLIPYLAVRLEQRGRSKG